MDGHGCARYRSSMPSFFAFDRGEFVPPIPEGLSSAALIPSGDGQFLTKSVGGPFGGLLLSLWMALLQLLLLGLV